MGAEGTNNYESDKRGEEVRKGNRHSASTPRVIPSNFSPVVAPTVYGVVPCFWTAAYITVSLKLKSHGSSFLEASS